MDLHHLEYMVEIANQQNISKAAQKLHVSQPTLSIYLTKLEKDLNLKLFHRTNNLLTITEAGEKYADTCRKILELKENLYKELYSQREDVLHMGILSSDAPIFSKVMQDFKLLYPHVSLKPIVRKSSAIYEAVLNGTLNFGFITSYSEPPECDLPNINHMIIQEYELMCCIAKNNPVYNMLNLKKGYLDQEDCNLLDSLNLSVSAIPMIRKRVLEDLIPSMNLHPKAILSDDNLELWSTTLLINQQYSFSPYSRIDDGIAQIPFASHPKIYKLLIYPKGFQITRMEKKVIQMVREAFKDKPYYYDLSNFS